MRLFNLLKSKPKYDGEHWDAFKWGCPDCGEKPFTYYSGPEGTGFTNICCCNPNCRSAFNTDLTGLFENYFARISNTVFRNAFPECPEESEAYLKIQILTQLNEQSQQMMEGILNENIQT